MILFEKISVMTRLLVFVLTASALCGTPLAAADAAAEGPEVSVESAEAIRATFDVFKSAIGRKHAEHALAEISENSLAPFEIIRRMAIAGKKLKIMGLAPSSRLLVFILRLKLTKEQLETMNAEDLFKTAVKNGWYGRAVVLNSKLDTIRGGFDKAEAQIANQSGPIPYHYSFVREEEAWKIELSSLNELLDAVLIDLWRSSEMDQNAFIMERAGMIAQEPVDDGLWRPLNARNRR